jgi:Ser/Thr protein kinase RdoA (MazF antagonist)
MLTYQPGKLLKQVPLTQALMMKVGKFIGEMDSVLKVSLTDTMPDRYTEYNYFNYCRLLYKNNLRIGLKFE